MRRVCTFNFHVICLFKRQKRNIYSIQIPTYVSICCIKCWYMMYRTKKLSREKLQASTINSKSITHYTLAKLLKHSIAIVPTTPIAATATILSSYPIYSTYLHTRSVSRRGCAASPPLQDTPMGQIAWWNKCRGTAPPSEPESSSVILATAALNMGYSYLLAGLAPDKVAPRLFLEDQHDLIPATFRWGHHTQHCPSKRGARWPSVDEFCLLYHFPSPSFPIVEAACHFSIAFSLTLIGVELEKNEPIFCAV